MVGAYPKQILLIEEVQRDFKYEKETDEYKVLQFRFCLQHDGQQELRQQISSLRMQLSCTQL